MSFRFIHTADWQIGRGFGMLPADRAALLREARLGVIERIAEAARQAGAGHVLVAGDVYDDDKPSAKTLRQPIARLKGHGDLNWHLISGNHDPHRPGGPWEQLQREGVPDNVRLHLTSAPVEIATGVWLLPAPLLSRATSLDPTAWMDRAPTPAGALRIGLAHGSVQGFGSDGEAQIPIDPDRPKRAGLAYLALGDWHGRRQVGERTWYSGTPEPERFLDNDPGHVLAVAIDGPRAVPAVTGIETAAYRWAVLRQTLDGAGAVALIERAFAALRGPPDRMLVKLVATGEVSVTTAADIEAGLDRLEASLCHLERDLSRLRISASVADLDSLRDEPGLAAAARRLESFAAAEGGAGADDARRALELLFAMTRSLSA